MRNPQGSESQFRWVGAIPLGLALALVVALWLGPVGVSHARAEDPSTPSETAPSESSVGAPDTQATPSGDTDATPSGDIQATPPAGDSALDSGDSGGSGDATPAPTSPQGYVAEIVDSAFVVGPAEFMALDLPANPPGERAAHLLGTVTVAKGDIMVRLFTASAYQGWLKKRGGDHANAFWTSKRDRAITLDQALPDGPVVILLDNGYSIRTPKHVRAQLQIQYQPVGTINAQATHGKPPGQPPAQDDIITPRANTEDAIPPPPPPPPPDSGNN
jgi:hypothetical protein